MYSGQYNAIWEITKMAVREKAAYHNVLEAAEDRADRKQQETGFRPDPQNSSNVKGQWARRRLIEEALAHCFTKERSERYASVGYDGVYIHSEEWTEYLDAAEAVWTGGGSSGDRDERVRRFEQAMEAVIVDAKCEEALQEAHREAVLAGEEGPTADDAEWLAEYAKSQADKANAMQAVADAARATAEALAAKAQKQ